MKPNTDGRTPEQLLEIIGVQDLEDGETYVSPFEAAASAAGDSLLVRGATGGGSPILNLATRAIIFIGFLALLGAGYGAWKLATRSRAPRAAVQSAPDGTFACKVRFWHRTPSDISARAPEIAGGALALPRDPADLAAAGGETFLVDQDRVDRFTPAGTHLAVRYAGAGPRVRSVSVSFAEARDRCGALRAVGLLEETTSFRVLPDGVLSVVSGPPHPFVASGGRVRVRVEGSAISVVQFEAGG